MPACLEAEYDSVLRTLMDYATYTVDMRSRLYLSEHWIRHLIPILPTVLFVSIGSPVLYDLIRRFANEKERSSPFYDVVLSDYPLETLALQIEAAHPGIQFAQIAKLFELRDKHTRWMSPSRWMSLRVLITGVLSVGVFLLNMVPDILIKKIWAPVSPSGVTGAEFFDVFVFLITVALVVLIPVIWAQYFFEYGQRERAVRHVVLDALGYLAIRQARSTARPDVAFDGP